MAQTNDAVLITGAAGGVGLATTRALVDKGYRVYAGVHSLSGELESIRNVHVLKLDVTQPDSVAAAVAEVRAMGDTKLAGVINNAGVIVQGPIELVPDDQFRHQFEVNVFGPASIARAFVPLLRPGRGKLINITASTARLPGPFFGPVSASKAALQAMSDALRVELAHWGIHVVIIEPGAMQTDIFSKAGVLAERVAQTQSPDQLALYSQQLAALQKAMGSMKLNSPTLVSDAIVKAMGTAKPKARYTVGPDNRLLGLLSRLPIRTRDSLISRVMGQHKVPKAG